MTTMKHIIDYLYVTIIQVSSQWPTEAGEMDHCIENGNIENGNGICCEPLNNNLCEKSKAPYSAYSTLTSENIVKGRPEDI